MLDSSAVCDCKTFNKKRKRLFGYSVLLGESALATLAALFVPGHDIPPLCLPTPLTPRDHQSGMYVEGVSPEVAGLHTRPTYTPA